MKRFLREWCLALALLTTVATAWAQPDRWQQRAQYEMDVDVDAPNHQYRGTQKLTYYNNSPDALHRVFYHLYYNAFQPGSMMDVRSRTIADPDKRVSNRIAELKPDEIGYLRVKSLKHNGKAVRFTEVGTILEVELTEAIPPHGTAVLEMEFEGQAPLQVRRAGRDNREGIELSMSQWYPKLCEYDYQGWHANPYVGREFHGVWGDFNVRLTIDKDYVVGGTGYLQNPQAVGHGYEAPGSELHLPKGDKLTWHFYAPNVHDFMWAADPDYKHVTAQVPDGPTLHFLYQEGDKTAAWQELPAYTVKAFQFISKHYGEYPYEQYSVIQGGDGGMEYPMATLITGHRKLASLVGVTVHEALHSWYQMILGSNESLYPWMDEGFTSYASSVTMAHLFERTNEEESIHSGSYQGYRYLAKSGLEEPMSTHADHYHTNVAYGLAAYSKGAVFLHQLEYIIGKPAFDQGMLDYFHTWKFKHPNPNDFIRVMEKRADMELDWYKEYWVYTTKTIDYAIDSVIDMGNQTKVVLRKVGKMPMPLDVQVNFKRKSEMHNIPMRIMRGEKAAESENWTTHTDWPWTNDTYELILDAKYSKIESIVIDPSGRMADIDLDNNSWKAE